MLCALCRVARVTAGVLLACASVAGATTIVADGDLSDWGVNLQLYEPVPGDTVNGHPKTRFLPASFVPASGVTYSVHNDDVAADHGGELFDVEAIYCTYDADNLYFAIVTSSDPTGARWDGYGNRRLGPGDLRVVVDGTSTSVTYGIGARPIDLTVYGRISELNGDYDYRDWVTWDSFTDVNGDGTYYTTAQARIESGAPWGHVDNPGVVIDAYFKGRDPIATPDEDPPSAYAEAAWKQWAAVGDYYVDDPYGKDEPYGTWIYEVVVPRSALALAESTHMLDLSFFALDCGNDAIELTGLALGPSGVTPIPEPISMIFFGTGIVAVAGFVMRRRMAGRRG